MKLLTYGRFSDLVYNPTHNMRYEFASFCRFDVQRNWIRGYKSYTEIFFTTACCSTSVLVKPIHSVVDVRIRI